MESSKDIISTANDLVQQANLLKNGDLLQKNQVDLDKLNWYLRGLEEAVTLYLDLKNEIEENSAAIQMYNEKIHELKEKTKKITDENIEYRGNDKEHIKKLRKEWSTTFLTSLDKRDEYNNMINLLSKSTETLSQECASFEGQIKGLCANIEEFIKYVLQRASGIKKPQKPQGPDGSTPSTLGG